MGISQDSWHKRRKTGAKRNPIHKKRKFELGRPAANTKVWHENNQHIDSIETV
jgi:small subunit ribosomal protein S8e